jgi:hypothetical protein
VGRVGGTSPSSIEWCPSAEPAARMTPFLSSLSRSVSKASSLESIDDPSAFLAFLAGRMPVSVSSNARTCSSCSALRFARSSSLPLACSFSYRFSPARAPPAVSRAAPHEERGRAGRRGAGLR